MNLSELVIKNRSYRRFHQDVLIELETLKQYNTEMLAIIFNTPYHTFTGCAK